jgi:diacylglycerol kinase family enzyme
MKAAAGYSPPLTKLEVDGRPEEVALIQMVVSNTRNYGGMLHFARHARANDGQLEMRLLTGSGALHKGGAVGRFLYNSAPWASAGQCVSCVKIEAAGIPLQLDGDYVGETPAIIGVSPRALTVVVPHGPLPEVFRGRPA